MALLGWAGYGLSAFDHNAISDADFVGPKKLEHFPAYRTMANKGISYIQGDFLESGTYGRSGPRSASSALAMPCFTWPSRRLSSVKGGDALGAAGCCDENQDAFACGDPKNPSASDLHRRASLECQPAPGDEREADLSHRPLLGPVRGDSRNNHYIDQLYSITAPKTVRRRKAVGSFYEKHRGSARPWAQTTCFLNCGDGGHGRRQRLSAPMRCAGEKSQSVGAIRPWSIERPAPIRVRGQLRWRARCSDKPAVGLSRRGPTWAPDSNTETYV
ncbi:hypothetical protein FQR65_LT20138 [Abscondita terminalis]|nr:hypothetical protein FQR65_LT20138 [Abscondita terminalis]